MMKEIGCPPSAVCKIWCNYKRNGWSTTKESKRQDRKLSNDDGIFVGSCSVEIWIYEYPKRTSKFSMLFMIQGSILFKDDNHYLTINVYVYIEILKIFSFHRQKFGLVMIESLFWPIMHLVTKQRGLKLFSRKGIVNQWHGLRTV